MTPPALSALFLEGAAAVWLAVAADALVKSMIVLALAGAAAHVLRRAPAAARHLVWLRDRLGERFTAGVVLHTGQRVYRLSDRILAAPISTLWASAA